MSLHFKCILLRLELYCIKYFFKGYGICTYYDETGCTAKVDFGFFDGEMRVSAVRGNHNHYGEESVTKDKERYFVETDILKYIKWKD